MLRRMSAKTFFEWQVFANLEPFEPERADARTGTIVMMLANVHRKKGSRAWTLAQCTPMFGDATAPKKTPKSWQQMQAMAAQLVAMNNMSIRQQTRRKRGS